MKAPQPRIVTIAFWITPPLMALVLFWPGLTCWFQKDDFAWLGLRQLVNSWHDLWWALFAPLAQGTIRTLSERAFFLSFSTLFGLNPLPYRCVAFLTLAGTLTVLSAVCTRLTGSRAAGLWAAIFYTVNGALAYAMAWTAIYYELACSFVLLLSLWLLIRYVETGQPRYYVAQWITFLLGFGVLELNVVYPALAAVYALCCAPRILKKVAPMFAVSALYTGIHFAVAPLVPEGPYRMFWDGSIFSTLWTYWKWSLGPSRLILFHIYPSPYRSALTAMLTLALIGFLIWKLSQREWVAGFFAAWFLIVIAPLLPLRNHVSEYYLTVPLVGLAMLGGWGFVEGWRARLPIRIAAISMVALYVAMAIPLARIAVNSFHDRSEQVRAMLLGVVEHKQPGKLILLRGVDREMFLSAIVHSPFRLYGMTEVYVASEERSRVGGDGPEMQGLFADPATLRLALEQNRAIVLDLGDGQVRDVTSEFRGQ